MAKNKNSIMGTYHTNLRNIGLYSSISIALLSFSNNDILKKELANNTMFVLGIVFLLVSFILSKELKEYSETNKEDISERLYFISKIINYTLIIFLTVIVYSVLHRLGIF
jgi:small-conductance mechanosensitive channel